MRALRAFWIVSRIFPGSKSAANKPSGIPILWAVLLALPAMCEGRVVSDQVEELTQYITLIAPTATVRQTSDPAIAEITFRPAASSLVAMLPQRFSRNIPIKKFNQEVWEGIFEKTYVPAVLTWSGNAQSEQGVFLTVSLKSINDNTGTISLMARVNRVATTGLSDKSAYAGKPIIYGLLKNAFLVLDDQQGRILRVDASGILDSKIASESDFDSGLRRPALISSCVIGPFTNCPNAKLHGVNLSGANLTGANLSGADLSNAHLARVRLSFANLRGADLSYSDLKGAILTNADLNGASLVGVDLNAAEHDGAQISADSIK